MAPDSELLQKMDASLMDYWGAYALAEGGLRRELPGALVMQTAIPHRLFNSVILTGDDPAVVDEGLKLGAACRAAVGVPVLWRLGVGAQGDGVRARLEEAGLEPSGSSPAMLFDLAGLPAPSPVAGLRIETAEGAAARGRWGMLAISAFEMDEAVGRAMGRCEASIPAGLWGDQPRFTAVLDGKPVAVSSLVLTGDVAGIYAVATLPEARRRGIGRAMTLHAMAEGRRLGAKMAVLQATEMGRPVYGSIGFGRVFDYVNYLQS